MDLVVFMPDHIASDSSTHRAKLTVSAVHAKSKRNSVAISILRVECELSYNGKCSRQHLQALCCHFRPDHILLGMGVDPNPAPGESTNVPDGFIDNHT